MVKTKQATSRGSKKGNAKMEIEDKDEPEYEVEQVLDHKTQNRKPVYLIKWKGFRTDEATWEPEENLGNIKKLIAAYEASKQGGKKSAAVEDDDDVLDDQAEEAVVPAKRGRKPVESKLNTASKKIQKQPKAAAQPKRGRKAQQAAVQSALQPVAQAESESEEEMKVQTKAAKGKFIKVDKAEKEKLGSFDYDRPLKISGHGVLNMDDGTLDVSDETVPLEKMYYRVEWEAKGKVKPKDSYYGFDILTQRCPHILLGYVKGVSFTKN